MADTETWPCFRREQRNDLGLRHVVAALARRGLVALAPDLNGAFTGGWGEPDDRNRWPRIVNRTLAEVAAEAAAGGGRFPLALQGRVNLRRLGFLGHSLSGFHSVRSGRRREDNRDPLKVAAGSRAGALDLPAGAGGEPPAAARRAGGHGDRLLRRGHGHARARLLRPRRTHAAAHPAGFPRATRTRQPQLLQPHAGAPRRRRRADRAGPPADPPPVRARPTSAASWPARPPTSSPPPCAAPADRSGCGWAPASRGACTGCPCGYGGTAPPWSRHRSGPGRARPLARGWHRSGPGRARPLARGWHRSGPGRARPLARYPDCPHGRAKPSRARNLLLDRPRDLGRRGGGALVPRPVRLGHRGQPDPRRGRLHDGVARGPLRRRDLREASRVRPPGCRT